MKKFLLASAFALLATPALFAQSSNTYSMQIELKDGTKITLGPNDLKNITFVDGVIKIEGNTIEELRSSIEKCEAQTLNVMEKQQDNYYVHEKMMAELQADQAASNAKIAKVQDMVATIEVAIMDLQKAVKELQSSGDGSTANDERIKALEDAVDKLKADMKNLSNIEQVKQLQDQIYALQAMVNVVATNSTGNQALADELKARMAAVEAAMANLNDNVTANQAAINQIKMESVDAKNRIAETKAELQERITGIRNELLEALAKTNSEIEKSAGALSDETKTKLEEMKGYLLNAIAEKDLEGQQRDEDLHNETRKWVQEVDEKVSYVWDTLIKKEIMERLLNIEERLDQIQQR